MVERSGKSGTSYAIWYRFNGRRVYRTVGRSQDGYVRADADRELQNVLADINRGEYVEPDEITFEQFVSEWYHRREPEWAPRTQRLYKDMIELHLSPYFGDYLLSQPTVEHIDGYKAAKLREGRLSPYSVNKTLSLLSSVLENAMRYRLIPFNPVRHVKRLKAAKPEGNFLEPFQVEPFLAAIRPECHRPLFETLIRVGLRIGEALGLKWADVRMSGSSWNFDGDPDLTITP